MSGDAAMDFRLLMEAEKARRAEKESAAWSALDSAIEIEDTRLRRERMLEALEQYGRERATRARRERIATAVLAGLVAGDGYGNPTEVAAKDAVSYADALIAELDK